MQTFISLDSTTEKPPINQMISLVRYNEQKPIIGYLIDEKTVCSNTITGQKETILNFKGFKKII